MNREGESGAARAGPERVNKGDEVGLWFVTPCTFGVKNFHRFGRTSFVDSYTSSRYDEK